ncbi:MAG: hypothetical protein L0Z73_14600 [Gammaproteobacteria bacterium]|nr:hypothetical protein [Gammaproteobacteria bacterium]
MMHKFYLCNYPAIFFFLISCANLSSTQAKSDPIAAYKDYINSLPKSSDTDLLNKYWSSARVTEGIDILADQSEENKLNRNAIIFSIRFPAEMKDILSTKQSIKDDTACVLVTGVTDESKKIVFNIPYILEKDIWKINEVFIKYLEDNQPVPTKPDCVLEMP